MKYLAVFFVVGMTALSFAKANESDMKSGFAAQMEARTAAIEAAVR